MTDTLPRTAILILAAGQSRRMRGADKMLEPVQGAPLILRQARVALAMGLGVWITLPGDRPQRREALAGCAVHHVVVEDAALGLSRSIVAGNAAIPAEFGLLLWLADLPEIDSDDLRAILVAAEAAPSAIVRATTAEGRPGHPVYFPAHLRGALAELTGDEGARDLLKQQQAATVFVALPEQRALTDLDTPEDWAAWRARSGR